MGNVTNSADHFSETDGTTVITDGCHLTGEISVSGNMYISGTIDGNVSSKATVVITSIGKMIGNITAKSAIVKGTVEGGVEVNHLEIMAGGKVNGTIKASTCAIELGGIHIGAALIKL